MVILTCALRTIVNRLYKENFDTTFVENIKKTHQKINYFIIFPYNILKIVPKPSLGHSLTFPSFLLDCIYEQSYGISYPLILLITFFFNTI